jgi:nucleotidyltransferase/DNA polymerase involved in DNA repair
MANNGRRPEGSTASMSPEAEALTALLGDLGELRDYLTARGQHTYELAQRFLHNAQRQSAERAYDERQATMLEYQHYVWHEIAGRVDQLLARYSSGAPEASQADEPARESSGEER